MFDKLRCFLKEIYIILIIKRSGLFDKEYYLKNNLDVARSCMDPVSHYVRHGWKEGRNPNKHFNTMRYLKSYPDIIDSDIDPLYHGLLSKNNHYYSIITQQKKFNSYNNSLENAYDKKSKHSLSPELIEEVHRNIKKELYKNETKQHEYTKDIIYFSNK